MIKQKHKNLISSDLIIRVNKSIRCALIFKKIRLLGKTSVRFVDVAAALQWDHMNVPSSQFWQDARLIFLLLSSLPIFPFSAFTSPRPSERQQRGAHGARRGLGDVLATLRTTPEFRQPSVDEQFEGDQDLLFNCFILGEIRPWQTLQDVVLLRFQMKLRPRKIWMTSLFFGSPRLGVMGTL